jgi:hypothetical protein
VVGRRRGKKKTSVNLLLESPILVSSNFTNTQCGRQQEKNEKENESYFEDRHEVLHASTVEK